MSLVMIIGAQAMSENRETLERLFQSGDIALVRSALLDQSPGPLPSTFSFDKIEGMMLGLAIGDALGITTESWLPSERQAEHGEIRDYIPNKYVDVPIGFPSDDTQLAFWTLEQMLADSGFRPENVADRFCHRKIFGLGSTVREFLRRRKSGRSWQQCGAKSAGNGGFDEDRADPHSPSKEPVLGLVGRRRLVGDDHPQRCRLDRGLRGVRGHAWKLLAMDVAPRPCWWPRTYVSIAKDLEGDTKYRPRGGEYLDYEGPYLAICFGKAAGSPLARVAFCARPMQPLALGGLPAGNGAQRAVHPDAAW